MKLMWSIVFGLMTTLLFTLTGCIDENEIMERLLKETPIGTKFEVVLDYCAEKKLKCKNSKTSGYLDQRTGQTVGVATIWASLPDHRTGLFSTESGTINRGFDKDGNLIDVWVWKVTDSL